MLLCRQLPYQERAFLAVCHNLNLAGALVDQIMVVVERHVFDLSVPENALCPDLLPTAFDQEMLVIQHPQTNKPIVLESSPTGRAKNSGFGHRAG